MGPRLFPCRIRRYGGEAARRRRLISRTVIRMLYGETHIASVIVSLDGIEQDSNEVCGCPCAGQPVGGSTIMGKPARGNLLQLSRPYGGIVFGRSAGSKGLLEAIVRLSHGLRRFSAAVP